MRARICHSLRVHFFLRFYLFIQSVACETCIEVLITAAATAIVVANGFAANASACSSTHRQEIGGGYFVFFIVFFFYFFILLQSLETKHTRIEGKCMRRRCGTCKFRCCCLFSFHFFSLCSATTHSWWQWPSFGKGPPHLVNCYRVRVVSVCSVRVTEPTE